MPALKSIEIVLKATGSEQVKSSLASVGQSARRIGSDTKEGADKAKGGLASLEGATKRLPGAFDAAGKSAKQELGGIESAAEKASGTLKRLVATAGLNALSKGLIDGSNEAERMSAKVETLAKMGGFSDRIGEIQKMGGALAALGGGDDDAIAQQISESISSGRTRGLASLGIYLNDAEQAAIKAGQALGGMAEKQATADAVLSASARYIKAAGDAAPEAALKIGQFGVAWGNAMEDVGRGAASTRSAWMSALTPVLEGLSANHKGALEFAGSMVEVGTQAANVGTPLIELASNIAGIRTAMLLSAAAKGADTLATGANTTAAGINTIAITAEGNAAALSAGKFGLLGRAKMLAMSPAGKVAGAVGLGVAAGVGIYNATRGDKPSAGEIGSYYWNRLNGQSEMESATSALGGDPYAKGDAAEAESLRLTAAGRARRAGAKAPLLPALSAFSDLSAAPVASIPAVSGLSRSFSLSNAPNAMDRGGFDMGAQILRAIMGGAQIGGGFSNPGPTRETRATQEGIYRTGDRELQARQSRTAQDPNGDLRIKFDDIVIPRGTRLSRLAGVMG